MAVAITADYIKAKVAAQGILQPMTCILEKGSGLIGDAIDAVTHGIYSHVEIITDFEYWGNKLVHHTIGAQAKGVEANILSYLWKEGKPIDFDVFVTTEPWTSDQLGKALEYLESMLWVDYGYGTFAHFLVEKIPNWLGGNWLAKKIENPKLPICSQLAAQANMAGGKFPANFDAVNCSPVSYGYLVLSNPPLLKKITIEPK
jgi:hypothetical protein